MTHYLMWLNFVTFLLLIVKNIQIINYLFLQINSQDDEDDEDND